MRNHLWVVLNCPAFIVKHEAIEATTPTHVVYSQKRQKKKNNSYGRKTAVCSCRNAL